MKAKSLLIAALLPFISACATQAPMTASPKKSKTPEKIIEAPHLLREISDDSMVRMVAVERTSIEGLIVHTKTTDNTTYTDASRVQTTMLVDYDCEHRFYRDTSVTIVHTFKKGKTQKPITYPLDNQWNSIIGPDVSADKLLAFNLVCGQDL